MWQRLWFRFLQIIGRDPRGIFHYWDGQRWRNGDPIVLTRSLMSHPVFDWDADPVKIADPDPAVSMPAIEMVSNTVREIFDIPHFVNGGLTETELCQLLWAFQTYLATLKKNGSGPQTSPPPTEPMPRFPGDGFITRPESDSGSTPSESVAGLPGTL